MDTLNKRRNSYKSKIIFYILVVLLMMFFHLNAVYASESTDISLLKQLRLYDIDSTSNIGIDMLRIIGYGLVKGLGNMMDGLYGAIGTIYKYLSFTTSDQLMGLVTRYSVIYKAIFIVSLTFFGIYLIHSKNALNQLNTVNCILVIIFVIAAMPLFAQKMTDLTVSSTNYVKNQWIDTADDANIDSIASTILTTNIVDLEKVDKNISGNTIKGLKKDKAFNNLKAGGNDWKMIDFNANMDYDEESYESDIWSSKLQMEDSGEYELTSMDDGLINSYYYRYQVVSWFNIFAELLSAVIVLFFVCFKCATLIFNIAMSMVYMPFVALTDLTTGQRTKEAIKNFVVLYATIFLCIALLGVYFTAFSFINEKINQIFPKVIMHIALAWVTLDGPDIIERISGVDVGYKGAWQKVMGARALLGLGQNAANTAKKGATIAGKAARTAGNVAVGKGTIDSAVDKMKDPKTNTVHSATDGKGLFGFGKNTVESIKDKTVPADSTKGLENIARKADADFGKNVGSVSEKTPNGVTDTANRITNTDTPKPTRADRAKDNLNANIQSGASRGHKDISGGVRGSTMKPSQSNTNQPVSRIVKQTTNHPPTQKSQNIISNQGDRDNKSKK